MSLAIDVQQLCKTYTDGWIRRKGFPALQDVSFQVQRGEIFGLLGPNGAGKTTFIKLMLGIVRLTGGRATLLGMPAGDRSVRRLVGYMPENLRIPRHHTALTALDLYGRLSGMSGVEIRQRQDHLLPLVGLADRRRDWVRKYSKGMLQRLGLAQALMHDPELLFLDEPTDGLDPVGRNQVRVVLRELQQQGKTIFLNSHLLQEVEMVCDRVAILDRGELRRVGTVAELAIRQSAGVELDMELAGAPEIINTVLRSWSSAAVKSAPGGHTRVHVVMPHQNAIDSCVDQLRSRGVSIVSLVPKKITLEDAFLQVLAEPAERA